MNSASFKLLGITLVLVILTGFVQYSFADQYISPRKQLESGVMPENIQCKDDRVLVIRGNGSPACVREKIANKMNWKIISDEHLIIQSSILKLQDSLIYNIDKEDELVNLASYAEYKKMFDKNFRLFSNVGWIDMSGRTTQAIMYYQDPANPSEIILDLDAMFGKKPVIFPEDSLMYIQTDKTEYNHGEIIHVKGHLADVIPKCSGNSVSVKVSNDNNSKFNDHGFTTVNADCSFELTIDTSGSDWIFKGPYTLTANPGTGQVSVYTEIELLTAFTPPQQPFDTNDTVLDLSSPTEFVDDDREYPRAMGHRGSPQLMYDYILETYQDFYVDEQGVGTFTSIPHEKYSINPKVGFYAEDWFPEYIPDGQKLLFTKTSCYEDGSCGLGITFVPTTFVLTPFTTNHDLNLAKGFSIGVSHYTLPLDELVDSAERLRESFIESEGGYGEIREMTRDGRAVLGFAGGNGVNPYQSSVSFHLDEFTTVNVHSNYYTLDELIPIFDSVMN